MALLQDQSMQLRRPFMGLNRRVLNSNTTRTLIYDINPMRFFRPFTHRHRRSTITRHFSARPHKNIITRQSVITSRLPNRDMPSSVPLTHFHNIRVTRDTLLSRSTATITSLLRQGATILKSRRTFALPTRRLNGQHRFNNQCMAIRVRHQREWIFLQVLPVQAGSLPLPPQAIGSPTHRGTARSRGTGSRPTKLPRNPPRNRPQEKGHATQPSNGIPNHTRIRGDVQSRAQGNESRGPTFFVSCWGVFPLRSPNVLAL